MEIVTGDRYLESLVKFVQKNTSALIEGTLILKLNPVGLHYVQSRLDALSELEALIAGAPVDYLRAYVSDLGDHRALEQLRRILCRLTSLKIVSVLQFPARDPTPLSLLAFGRLKVLELRGCDLSTSAAKGLLELRHTLEKLICHNSTDALRHVFASRIADIKESSQWNRLSFVSCACNGLILMDESLQLLSAVETLDLSRNKFAKVDNLRKCTRLTHLDIGFNQLRSIASFSEVTCHIQKLVLRNNALTTLRGIENLKFIEELDVSYNVISNYVELEVFSSLSSLRKIWLEGNPLCCTRWYRPQVFSFFLFPEQVKLDDKGMSTREFWKRQIIIARRHRRPASYGFYCPAREEREVERFINGKRKKFSRLACIESDDSGMNIEPDLLSCNNDVQSGEEDISDDEGELSSLLNRIEFMKKERSKLWLEEFKDWMDQVSENLVDENKDNQTFGNSHSGDTSNWRHYGNCSRYFEYISDSNIHSEDDSRKNALEPNSSFASSAGNHSYQWLHCAAENGEKQPKVITKGKNHLQAVEFNSATSGSNLQAGDEVNASLSTAPLITSNNIKRLTSFSGTPVSPPHYEEDILYRRHSLEEEILQVSVESFSAASSDSYTSSDEDHRHESGQPSLKTELYVDEEVFVPDVNWKTKPHSSKDGDGLQIPEVGRGWDSQPSCVQQSTRELGGLDKSLEVLHHSEPLIGDNNENISTSSKQDADYYERKYSKRKPKKRVISLSDSTSFSGLDVEEEKQKQTVNIIGSLSGNVRTVTPEAAQVCTYSNYAVSEADDHIESHFNSHFADSAIHETCKQFIVCTCLDGKEPLWSERKVAVVLSSESKLYLILLHGMIDGSGNSLSLMASHKAEDVREVLVGLGLLFIWVYINDETSYMLITRCEEKTRHLLYMIGLTSPKQLNKCSVRSMDQVQLNLFDRHIAESLGISIYQYSMVLFQHERNGEEEWLSRSIIVNEGLLIVCIEDYCHFSSLTMNEDAPSYYLLDSCHSIADVSEMVIEAKKNQSVTLTFREDSRVPCFPSIIETMKLKVGLQNKSTMRAKSWKLKWFSGESLCKFVTVVNAIHRGMATPALSIVYMS